MSAVFDFEVKEVMDNLLNEVVKREEMKEAGVVSYIFSKVGFI